MTPSRSYHLADWLLLLLVLGVAGGARAWYLCEFADCGKAAEAAVRHVQDSSPEVSEGQTATDLLVNNLKGQGIQGFRTQAPLRPEPELTAHVSPGYPIFRGSLEGVVEAYFAQQAHPLAAVRWTQVVLGALAAGCYFALARRAFDSTLVATLAGLFCALHPFWVMNVAELNDGTLASSLLAVTLLLGARAGQRGGALSSFLYGLFLALLTLVRAALLPFALVALLWFLLRGRAFRLGWLYALLALLGFVNGLAPWLVRNYQAFRAPIPIADSAWYHLWVGNNPHATGGPFRPQMEQEMGAVERARLAELEQPARYSQLANKVRDEVTTAPEMTLQRRFYAGLSFWTGMSLLERQGIIGLSQEGALPAWMVQAFYGTLLGMLVLALLGWRWSYSWWRTSMPMQLAVFWIPLPYLLSHAELLHGPRLPLDGPLLCLAALAVVCLIPGLGGRLLRGEALAAAPHPPTGPRL